MIAYKSNIKSITIIACVWFAAFASLYSDSLNSIALYIVLPFAFILSFMRNGYKLATNKYMKILVMLYIWCLLSCLWATYTEVALRDMRQILGTFLISYIFAVNAKNKKMVPWLYGSYIVLFASAWLYAQSHILVDMGEENFRMNDEKLNANTMAYYLFYVTFLIYMLGEIINKSYIKKFWLWLFWLVLPLSFITALLTASRQVLLIQIPLIGCLLYLRYIKGSGVGRRLCFVVAMIAAVIYVAPSVLEQYNNSNLATRTELSVKDDSRSKLFFDAVKVGWEHFPLGVGAGNYVKYSYNKHFSHNNYTELWANVGVVGLCLYCYLILLFIGKQWKRFKYFRNKEYLVFLLFGVIYSFDGVFYVFYNSVWLMSFFILVATHCEYYFIQHKNKMQ